MRDSSEKETIWRAIVGDPDSPWRTLLSAGASYLRAVERDCPEPTVGEGVVLFEEPKPAPSKRGFLRAFLTRVLGSRTIESAERAGGPKRI